MYQNDVEFTLWHSALGGTERNYAEFEYLGPLDSWLQLAAMV